MSDLNRFLESQGETGVQQSEGVFTVAPDVARRKLADSVPEEFSNGWSALCFLGAALRLSGLVPSSRSMGGLGVQPLHNLLTFSREVDVRMAVRYCPGEGDDWESLAKNLRDKLVASCESPMSETTPVGICLSRAVLILTKLGLSASFQFVGCEQSDYILSGDPDFRPVEKSLGEARGKESHGFVVWIQESGDWRQALSQHKDDYPLYRVQRLLKVDSPLDVISMLAERAQAKEFSLFGLKLQRESVWTQSPVQEILELGFCKHAGGWFDYRCKQAILAEVYISTPEVTPLILSSKCANTESGQEMVRPGELMSNWERFRSQAERLILRWWDAPPSFEHSRLYTRAVFAVGLSEAPSRIVLLNWGQTKEQVSLPHCPPGLGGVIYWPGLKQSLYGESWVRDEAYEAAVEWASEQAKLIFKKLGDEFDYIWEMMLRDHVRKSYRAEVERRLRAWLKPD